MPKRKRATSYETLENKFRELDWYGQPIGFNIDGDDEYTTSCGACVSLFFIVILIFYGVSLIRNIF